MNASECGALAALFPGSIDDPPKRLTNAGALAFQALPTVSVLLVWLFLEARRRRAPTRHVVGAFVALGIVAVGALGLLVWRTFELLDCDPQTDVDGWAVFGLVGSVGVALALLLGVAPRMPRVALGAFVAAAAGTVAVDWCLRGGVVTSPAAQHLVATQQVVALLGVCAMQFLRGTHQRAPRQYTTAPPRAATHGGALEPVDALTKRRDDPPPEAAVTGWSWFAV